MKDIAKELWLGNVRPNDDCRPRTDEYNQLLEYILRHKTALTYTLNNPQLEEFEKLDSCVNEYVNLSEEAIFTYAYRLGIRTAMEALQEDFKIE